MRISDWSSDVCSSDLDAWNAIRPNMEIVSQAADRWAIITGPLDAVALELEDRAFAGLAADVFATLSWSDDVWKDLTSRLKEQTGRKRSEEHTAELQSLMRISYAVFCLTKKTKSAAHVQTSTNIRTHNY